MDRWQLYEPDILKQPQPSSVPWAHTAQECFKTIPLTVLRVWARHPQPFFQK